MEILSKIWSYFATNILQQPAFMIGFIVLIGYIRFRDHGMIFWQAQLKQL